MKKRILFVLHMPPPVHGASMVGKFIHDSKYINSRFECVFINLSTSHKIEDIGKVGLKKICNYISLLSSIRRILKSFRPNLVYITPNASGRAFYKDFLLTCLLKYNNCKIIYHFHNKGVSLRSDKIFDNILYSIFFKNVKVILLSDHLYSDVRKYVIRENVYICPNGIAESSILNSTIPVKENNVVPHILYLSNLIKSKGILVLLDALVELKNRGLSFCCDIVGGETEGISYSYLNSLIVELGLKQHVFLHGKIYGIEKDLLYEQSDIFVFPTFYKNECFPLVLLEAMQHKLPIISTNEGGIPDIVIDGVNGYLLDVKSVNGKKYINSMDLVIALQSLILREDLRKSMGTRGYDIYIRYYTLSQFERRFSEILEEV